MPGGGAAASGSGLPPTRPARDRETGARRAIAHDSGPDQRGFLGRHWSRKSAAGQPSTCRYTSCPIAQRAGEKVVNGASDDIRIGTVLMFQKPFSDEGLDLGDV